MTEQLAYTIAEAVRGAAISRSELYRAINRGDLTARKRGRRTLILASELQRWLESLPSIQGPKSKDEHRRETRDE